MTWSWMAVAVLAFSPRQGSVQPNRALWDFETPDQADWHFLIEGGKGDLKWHLAGPEAEPHGGEGCLAVDFRFGGDPENHLKLEWYRRHGAWDLGDYVGLEAWVKPVGGAGRALVLSHWFNDGTHWWRYRAQGWDDLQDDRWNRVTIAFEDGVGQYGPDAGYDPAKTSQLIFVLMNRAGQADAVGTLYLDDIHLIERPGLQPPYRPQLGVWFTAAFKPDGTPNPVLNWRLPRMLGIRPQIGYYDSADPQVIAWQLDKMRQAGIDFPIIDVPPLDPVAGATQAVLRELRGQPEGVRRLQYCFQLESYGATPSLEVLRPAAEAIWEACGSDPLHLRYRDKPLLVVFSPTPVPAERWDDERFTVRWVTPEPDDWKYCDAYPQTANRECMCVSPGACNLLEYLAAPQVVGSIFCTPAEGGAYFAKQAKWALDNQPDLIYLASWNDWAFGNMLEPSDECGERYVNLLAEILDIYAGVRRRQ